MPPSLQASSYVLFSEGLRTAWREWSREAAQTRSRSGRPPVALMGKRLSSAIPRLALPSLLMFLALSNEFPVASRSLPLESLAIFP